MPSHADRIVGALRDAGVQRIFGIPGGGSSADLIETAARSDLPFSLAHTETAAAFMAAAQAEVSGNPGACLATLGPGAASLMNGVANAHLDRVPLLVLTDCQPESSLDVMQHQNLPHSAMFSPVVKWSRRIRPDSLDRDLCEAIAALLSFPPGPVHLDISTDVTGAPVADQPSSGDLSIRESQPSLPEALPADVRRILAKAQHPVLLAGLAARSDPTSRAVREFCDRFHVPVLVTYKAKGVVPDAHPWFGGVLTNGQLERELLDRADVFIAAGLDPVELLPRPWTLPQPVISLTPWPIKQRQIPLAAELVGDVALYLKAIAEALPLPSVWRMQEVAELRQNQCRRMRPAAQLGEFLPHRVVEIAAEFYRGRRASVDAGAFMFPVMAHWPAENPRDVLISNGLATMGFALPAAIGAALLDTSGPTLAFTGDAGLLMCLGELRTAAREGLPLRIVVFEDGALSLIKIKQLRQAYRTGGVTIGGMDWPALAGSMGVLGRRADNEEVFRRVLAETENHPGPVLLAAKISPDAYPAILSALRG